MCGRLPEMCCFNPRPRAGGDRVAQGMGAVTAGFNPRPRAGGDKCQLAMQLVAGCFNPRPRAGGDLIGPVQEAIKTMFQSTPPRGGRRPSLTCSVRLCAFQSTPPRGGRRNVEYGRDKDWSVSIHAPARGATGAVSSPWRNTRCFNPRPRAGGDWQLPLWKRPGPVFQSTPPRGGRH